MLKKLINWILGDFEKKSNKKEYDNTIKGKFLIRWIYTIGSIVMMLIRLAF